ncbi:hypothetical protein DOTSEDRAFT_67951 [Dothistroma septosporum NZE10]|uniref:Uncharacterized protein n=1 Tax=Dothistroma septosporum (strain NZE10 / CBS 128990) TaxID=675120 RepID=N1Q1D3_DOTSN|nr:hypothetical protein DOTSEDRAFT_67951 [Dothistroma septosporum NZE10]
MASGIYLRFLQSPNTGDLASDATINYITTTTTINEPTAILKHISAQAKQVEKKNEDVLYTIEDDNGCCVETAVTLQFRAGGGAFLPGMDSNMLDEREVTFPLTHVVSYNNAGKIQQIRLYWDQGTLLKQVEAIGKTGRNWPIREGKALVDAVTASIKSGGGQTAHRNGKPPASHKPNEVVISGHQKRGSVSVTRDPHASLTLFAERDPNEDGRTYSGPKYDKVKSAKPGPRDYGELFASEETAAATGSTARSQSPHKNDGTVLKAGAGKHFKGNRLFEEDEHPTPPRSPERKKTYDQKYEHFAFGNGEDVPKENRPASKAKGNQNATFSFEDFSTPPKHVEKKKPDYERHWGAGVDEDDPSSPPKRPIVHAARKDAAPHFELVDDSPMPVGKIYKTAGDGMGSRKGGKGWWDIDSDREADESASRKKATTTNVNNARRGDDFGSHHAIADSSPTVVKAQKTKPSTRPDQKSNWSHGESEGKKIYKTAGDGMGSRSGGRAWGIGDDSDPEVDADVRPSARSRRAQQAQADVGADDSDF